MTQLLQTLDTNLWMELSALVYGLLFIGLVAWVYSPFRKRVYEQLQELPFDQE